MVQLGLQIQVEGGPITPVIKMPSSASTILDVKQEIEARLGVEVARQTIWTPTHEFMDDFKTIDEYGCCHVLQLQVEPPAENVTREIKVIPDAGGEHKYVVKEIETVLDLKKKVGEELKAEAEDIKLFMWNHGNEMKNHLQLYKYYIRHGTKISASVIKKAGEIRGEASKKTDTGTGSTTGGEASKKIGSVYAAD